MSYLGPDIDPDIFVSYSHGDPREPDLPLKEWTQALVRRLERQLRSLDTEFDELNLWIDRRLDPTAFLTDELRGKVSACGLLMIVMSNCYLASDWCKDELDWFREQVQDRTVAGGRVFIIRAQDTDTKQWPDFLRDKRGHAILGFPFYDSEDHSSPLSFELNKPNDEYFKALGTLRVWLIKRLREMRDRAAKSARTKTADAALVATTPAGSRRIYLHSPPACELVRDEIGQDLLREGIITLTANGAAGGNLLAWQREASERIERARRCEALALLRVDAGERFVGDLLDIGVDERERIAVARGAPLPCAVLDKTGEGLPKDLAQFGIERFDVNRNEWRAEFRAWLDAARAPPAQAQ